MKQGMRPFIRFGQGLYRQRRHWMLGPTQFFPPPDGGGLVQVRRLYCLPQLRHVDQGPQLDQPPSGILKEQRLKSFKSDSISLK